MPSHILFNLAFLFYLLSSVVYMFSLCFKKEKAGLCSGILLALAFVLHTLLLALRFYQTRQPPLVTFYESLLFYSWSIVLAYGLFRKRLRLQGLSGMISLLSLFLFGVLSLLDKTSRPLIPALKSNWLFIHVSSYFIGYGAATLAFIFAVLYLMHYKQAEERSLLFLDNISFRLISFAFIFLTIGLTTGSVWANVAWGSWWSWDPKETWSLITWLVYAFYLHLRLVRGKKGRISAYLNILGFICILFTFLGVNYLLKGLHSYM